jgi:hypothetical protein
VPVSTSDQRHLGTTLAPPRYDNVIQNLSSESPSSIQTRIWENGFQVPIDIMLVSTNKIEVFDIQADTTILTLKMIPNG